MADAPPTPGPDSIRIAVYAAPLTGAGPGAVLGDILRGTDDRIEAVIEVLGAARPDILVLAEIDWDAEGRAPEALSDRLAGAGLDLPHVLAPRPNGGRASGADLDADGRWGEPEDALGYGAFTGSHGVAILSRWPLVPEGLDDATGLLWRDQPDADMPEGFWAEDVAARLPVATSGIWSVPVDAPGAPLTVVAFAAGPPVFDGPEDRNGRRNAAELRLAAALTERAAGPVVLAGKANVDPVDGEGDRTALAALLDHRRLQDPRPASAGGAAAPDPGHRGPGALDTADWADGAPGNLRVSYVLPDRVLSVRAAGVVWPGDDTNLGQAVREAGPHRLVWVDLEWPPG